LTDLTWIGETRPTKYVDLFLRNLDNPVELWSHAFRNQLSDRARHLLFVLTTMPVESLMADVELTFNQFHSTQCARFGIARSAIDFKNSLKELDGTFVDTWKVQDAILLRFQNPSIRDFMEHLLLSGEMLQELIESVSFFEQAEWLWELMKSKEVELPSKRVARHGSMTVSALQRLFEVRSCSAYVFGTHGAQRITISKVNPAERLATIVLAAGDQNRSRNREWINARIAELATRLESRRLTPSSFVRPIAALQKRHYLRSKAGKQLISALKHSAMQNPCDLHDFETLANLANVLPQFLGKSELQSVREAYSNFVGRYPTECYIEDPGDLRDEAVRVGNVGKLLKVDTEDAQDALTESADEIEREERGGWEDDEDRGHVVDSDPCSDKELDSMFGTLRK